MPSPSPIPRSSSYPNISSSSTARRRSFVPPSSRSVSSARSSAKFSYWPHWSNINQLGNLILPGRRCSDSSSKHSDLTEESLEAHNRRHAPIVHNRLNAINIDQKNAKCSPYYKGLTDASLVINRERLLSSPGRESHATSTSSSLSSFIFKMQEWSSCLTFKHKEDNHAFNNSTSTNTVAMTKQACAASSVTASFPKSAPAVTSTVNEMNLDKEHVNILSLDTGKPLRERVSESETSAVLPYKLGSVSVNEVRETKNKNSQEKKNEEEFIWANKYRPKTLKDFICNRDKAIQLQDLVREGELGNFIFEGPPGVGKRTMIWAMLREAYGPDKLQTREEYKAFDLKGESIGSILVNVKESPQHVEVNVSDLRGYEKYVIAELMKDSQTKKRGKAFKSSPENTRAIILRGADKLSTDALLYIRWLVERHKGLNKIIFCCSDVSKLQPIKSLCTVIQLFPPSKEEIVEVLEFIARQEGIELPNKLAEKIADNSKNNLRQAIRSFEASWQKNYPFVEDQVILTGWEDDITDIAKKIIEEQSPKQLYIIRGKLQNLIEHDVCLHFIFKSLVGELKRHLDVGLHRQIDGLYDEYKMDDGGAFDAEKPFVFARSRYEEQETGKKLDDPSRKNVQHFLRIEEFVAKFMSRYKTKVANNNRCEQQVTAS